MKTILEILIALLIFCNISNSQQVTWQRILNNNYALFYKDRQIFDGGVIAEGTDRINANKLNTV